MDYSKLPERITVEGDWDSKDVTINGILIRPAASLKVRNHSPDGFNWGYGGSGPAQLALALLLLFLPQGEAVALYQGFKFLIVAAWPQSDFREVVLFRETIEKLVAKKAG